MACSGPSHRLADMVSGSCPPRSISRAPHFQVQDAVSESLRKKKKTNPLSEGPKCLRLTLEEPLLLTKVHL
ncbi:unnamed protein product [Nezara viridula]|uniref:Uncharacterized protein n=1 Tax=Nezara viridula TaxID=85310 RepID=A0A9P0HP09_NEZVI|nr:unnamed protein product [Nezara viridula]